MKRDIKKLIAYENDKIIDVIEIINKNELKHAFIVDKDEKLLGIVSDGDIRRAILNNFSLTLPVKDIMIKNPLIAKSGVSESDILNILIENKILIIPILDDKKRVIGYYHITDFIKEEFLRNTIKKEYDSKKTNRILVTGGTGYIGSILVRILLENNYSVRVLDKLLFGKESVDDLMVNPNFELIQGDFTKIEDLIQSLKDVSVVIHLAAIVGDPAGNVNPELTEETNFHGVKILAEFCKYYGIKKFIFLSTCSVYGASKNKILDEESELNPVSLYAKSKLKAEKALIQLKNNNFYPCILRLATVFGLSFRMRFDLVVNLLTAYAVNNKEISIYSGEQWRPFIHVKDVCYAILSILKAPNNIISGEIFNVANEKINYQIKDLGNLMNTIFPDIKVNYVKTKEDERSYRVTSKKLREKINFIPKYDLEDGVKEIAHFLKNNYIDVKDKRYSNYKNVHFGVFDSIYFI
ncbi:MAG: NAD-dependent epimerase/dehydratase family protein [Candidatus Hermodarchaeota archaeon]